MHSDLPPTLLRGYVQLSTSVVPGAQVPLVNTDGSADPAAERAARRWRWTAPTTWGRRSRHEGPARAHPVPQPAADRRGRQPVPPGRHHRDGRGHGAQHGRDGGARSAEPDVRDGRRSPRAASPRTGPRCTCTAASRRGSATARRTSGSRRPSETTPYPKGVSVQNVPDMPDPGPGAMTFFYTNQQSARLMFYHDHAWGITRLNVYAGEAAAYLITDPDRAGARQCGRHPRPIRSRSSSRTRPSSRAPSSSPCTDPTWDIGQVGRRRQPVGAARLRAGAEPGRQLGRQPVRPLGLRPLVLAAHVEHRLPADRQPVLRPELRPRRRAGASRR